MQRRKGARLAIHVLAIVYVHLSAGCPPDRRLALTPEPVDSWRSAGRLKRSASRVGVPGQSLRQARVK
jgi:hypothetical protein